MAQDTAPKLNDCDPRNPVQIDPRDIKPSIHPPDNKNAREWDPPSPLKIEADKLSRERKAQEDAAMQTGIVAGHDFVKERNQKQGIENDIGRRR